MSKIEDRYSRLLLLAIDPDSQDDVAECIDEWNSAGLLQNIFLLNIGASGEEFETSIAGDPTWRPLETTLNHLPWHEITIISIRSYSIGNTLQQRVGKEEALFSRIRDAYPATSALQPKFFTISVYAPSQAFSPAHLPKHYSGNFLHEPNIFIDERLPRQPLGRDIATTLAFTAVVAGGGLRSQHNCPIAAINDSSLDASHRVRFIRAVGRGATAGFLLDRSIRRVIGPGAGTSLVETAGISVVDDDPKLIADLSAEVIIKGEFDYRRTTERVVEEKVIETGLIQALKQFFSGFGYYLGKAVETTVKSRIEERARTFLDAFQELLFGDDSSMRIKGTTTFLSPERALEELSRRASELKDIEEFGRIESRPIPSSDTWKLLVSATMSALDGSETADGATCLQKGGIRTVFRRPNVLGPAPSISDFLIASETLTRLGIDEEYLLVDALDFNRQGQLEEILRKVRLDGIFSGEVAATSPVAAPLESRIHGAGLRESRITESKETTTSTSDATVPVETISEIRSRFTEWRARLKSEFTGTLLWEVSTSLNAAIKAAKGDYKFDSIKKIFDEMVDITPPARGGSTKLFTGVGAFTVILIIVGGLLSKFGPAWIISLPITLIFFVIWLFTTSATLGRVIIRRAIDLRKFDFACKKADTELNRLIRITLNAVKEYSRLVFLERQFTDWSRAIREIAHAPFGRLSDIDDAADRLLKIPHPPQFAISSFHSRPEQISKIDREVWMRILRIGYLSDVFRALRAKWSDEYNMYSPGGLEPESDTGQKRVIARAERRPSGKILNPRSDFSESLLDHYLRASVTEGELASISRWFADHHLSSLFSSLSHVDSAHHAFDKFSPEDFLLGLVIGRRSVDFDPNIFAPGIEPRVDNVELSFSWKGDASLGSFDISPEKPLHFVTWALDIGHCHPISSLIGGRSSDPSTVGADHSTRKFRS